ncbi:hypothetical protein [uncultured Methylobacterium sp.]|jgi:hypothetical protein|uniref:hypothetical protein n=1 Tax=uncultured Methylobacterium sp. TaxID=157278 RepID=UPI002628A429|nr:hypothetical protein [uncultured Methylobacterium sp.]
MNAKTVHAPPKGFRKSIPCDVKVDVVVRQDGRCASCGERLGTLRETQFDHEPALQLRAFDPDANDTIPPANDPEALKGKHKLCHLVKTTGRKGESDKNAIHGDVAEIHRLRRLTQQREEFQRRVLAKGTDEGARDGPEKKSRWPKRPFNSRGRRESPPSRSEARDRVVDGDRRGRRLPALHT